MAPFCWGAKISYSQNYITLPLKTTIYLSQFSIYISIFSKVQDSLAPSMTSKVVQMYELLFSPYNSALVPTSYIYHTYIKLVYHPNIIAVALILFELLKKMIFVEANCQKAKFKHLWRLEQTSDRITSMDKNVPLDFLYKIPMKKNFTQMAPLLRVGSHFVCMPKYSTQQIL